MSRIRYLLLIAFVGSVPLSTAQADIVPSWALLSQQPVPTEHYWTPGYDLRSENAPFVNPYPDAPVDVALVSSATQVDLYPTLACVRANYLLRGGDQGAEDLTVGFPEHIYGMHPREPEGLSVRVNGERVAVDDDLPDDVKKWVIPRKRFWQWTIDVPAGEEVMLEVAYQQIFHSDWWSEGRLQIFLAHVIGPGALWQGPITNLRVFIHPHGIDPSWLEVATGGSIEIEDPLLVMSNGTEPINDIRLLLSLPAEAVQAMRYGRAPYDVSALPPHLRLVDAVVRFGRTTAATGNSERIAALFERLDAHPALAERTVDQWECFLALLERTTHHADPRSRQVALLTMQNLARWLDQSWESFTDRCMPAPLPAVEDPFEPPGFSNAHLSYSNGLDGEKDALLAACAVRQQRHQDERQLFVLALTIFLAVVIVMLIARWRESDRKVGLLFASGTTGALIFFAALIAFGERGSLILLPVIIAMFGVSVKLTARGGVSLHLSAALMAAPGGLLIGVATGGLMAVLMGKANDPIGVGFFALPAMLAAALAASPANWRQGLALCLGLLGGLSIPLVAFHAIQSKSINLLNLLVIVVAGTLSVAAGCIIGERRARRTRANIGKR